MRKIFTITIFLSQIVLFSNCVLFHNDSSKSYPSIIDLGKLQDELVVLIDKDFKVFHEVLGGINIASKGNYNVIELGDDEGAQNALFETLVKISPRAMITLGPRSSNALERSRVVLPAAYALVPGIENHEMDNVFLAGVRMTPSLKDRVNFFRELFPQKKQIGVIFSRRNSSHLIQDLKSIFDDQPVELISIEVQNSMDVLPALLQFKNDFSAFLMIEDPVMLEKDAIKQMIDFFAQASIPFLALDCSLVKNGALVAFGQDYFKLGEKLASLVLDKNSANPYRSTKLLDPVAPHLCLNWTRLTKLENSKRLSAAILKFAAQRQLGIKIFY